ncbi:MAG: hypothetical protein AAGC55_14515 [Myxococcota bacterium]
MARFLRTEHAAAALRALLEENARKAADENTLIARGEESALHPFLMRFASIIRTEGGPGTLVRVDALVERAMAQAMAVWELYNAPSNERDARFLSLDEIAAIEAADLPLGALTRAARERALAPADAALVTAVQAWFERPDFDRTSFRRDSLPGGGRVDVRVGQPERDTVPALVAAAFDFYARAEAADIASVSLHRGTIDGHELWAVYTSTDGDDAYLEVLDRNGITVIGARYLADSMIWDDFPGRVRLAPRWTRLDGYESEEGLHEPDERAAAGQPPMDWAGELRIDQGRIDHVGALMGSVDFGELTLTDEQRDLAVAGLEMLWELHLRHVVGNDERPLTLGGNAQGVLAVGPFTRSTSGETFLTADWRDIDNSSYVLYFDTGSFGLRLRIQQYDN